MSIWDNPRGWFAQVQLRAIWAHGFKPQAPEHVPGINLVFQYNYSSNFNTEDIYCIYAFVGFAKKLLF